MHNYKKPLLVAPEKTKKVETSNAVVENDTCHIQPSTLTSKQNTMAANQKALKKQAPTPT
jgi:hypothetical protein